MTRKPNPNYVVPVKIELDINIKNEKKVWSD